MTRRSAALVGLAIVAVYVTSAAFAGHLSPLARGPLLDDGAPLGPYRWVSPPPALASTNQAPASATTDVPLGSKGNRTLNLVTSDKQAILILAAGVIPPHGSDTKVRVDVDPVDPATLAPLGHGLSAFGNAYRITGTYLPSKTSITNGTAGKLDIVLVYPVTSDLYANKHQMLYAPTGKAWTGLKSTDLYTQQQIEAQPPGMGYVVVAGVPGPPIVSSSPVSGSGGSANTLSIALAVAAGAALLIGLGLVLRNRRR